MRLSIHETSLGPQTFHDKWAIPKFAGFDGISLCYGNRADVAAMRHLGYAVQVADMARRYDLAVSGMHLDYLADQPFLVTDAPAAKEATGIIEHAIAVASRLAAPVVTIPIAGPNTIGNAHHREAAARILRPLGERAQDSGVVLAIDASMAYDDLEALFSEVDMPSVQYCYDTGDAAAAQRDSIRTIRSLGPRRIAQVQFKDVMLSGPKADHSVRLGRGIVRFDAVMFALRSVLYDGWIVLKTPPGDASGQILSLHLDDARAILSRGLDAELPKAGQIA